MDHRSITRRSLPLSYLWMEGVRMNDLLIPSSGFPPIRRFPIRKIRTRHSRVVDGGNAASDREIEKGRSACFLPSQQAVFTDGGSINHRSSLLQKCWRRPQFELSCFTCTRDRKWQAVTIATGEIVRGIFVRSKLGRSSGATWKHKRYRTDF